MSGRPSRVLTSTPPTKPTQKPRKGLKTGPHEITRQEKAKGLLLCTVSFHLQVELDKLRPNPDAPDTEATAEQLWRHLEEKFAKNDIRAALLNYEKLIRTTITDDDTIEDQLNGLQTLHWKCSLDGFGFVDWQFAALILGLLPPSYKPVMYHFLENSPPSSLSSTAVCAYIVEYRNRKQEELRATAATNALAATKRKPGGTGKRSRNQRNRV